MAMVPSFLFSGWHRPLDPRPLGRFLFMKRLQLFLRKRDFQKSKVVSLRVGRDDEVEGEQVSDECTWID
jgi:hypothetical protein